MVLKGDKRGQVTIFIIIAILIVAGIGIFFTFRESITSKQIPASIDPVYNTFLSCLDKETYVGIDILESQAGYITLPNFQPGSNYMPFSSQLDFLGNPIPYWYYVSGNNIQKEQVPSKAEMEKQLGDFIKEKINACRFDNYYEQGFGISFNQSGAKVDIKINKDKVDISLNMNLNISKGEESVLIKNHKISVNSKLGMLYNSAKKLYEYEQETLFLENYTIDTLRLYAPVDGVKLTCSPLTWNANDVFDKLQKAIEVNTLALKTKQGYFSLKKKENKYFVEDISVEGNVRFLNSRNWTYSFEVNPSEGNMLISQPVGNQAGMGILGFCYTPYHFVYNVKYPVLVQISSDDNSRGTGEIFQFPLAVVIQGNNPRKALETNAVKFEVPELCDKKNTEIQVNVFDTKLNPVDAKISYECFGTKCDIGKSSSGVLKGNFPQCANGDVIAKASGYKDTRYQFSTVNQGIVDVIMDKLYDLNIKLKLNNIDYNGEATISFISDDNSRTIVYPEQKTINLSEGQYEVQVHIYKNSSLTLGATKSQKCIEIPQSGVGGFLGFTKEKCFTIEFPAQVVSNALSGGGKKNYYILESELSNSNTIEINSKSLPTPTTIEKLQNNYITFDERSLDIKFK